MSSGSEQKARRAHHAAILSALSSGKAPDMSLPSFTEQAKNFIRSAATHAASGFKDAAPDVIETRVELCTACEFLTSNDRCAKCGCFMKVKARWESSVCPVGKW